MLSDVQSAESDQGIHCLLMSPKRDARHKWVNSLQCLSLSLDKSTLLHDDMSKVLLDESLTV